jgi:hypothetical protein
VLGLGVLLLGFLARDRSPIGERHVVARQVVARKVLPAPPGNPSQAALSEACRGWTRAQKAVTAELDLYEGWDQRSLEEPDGVGRERWRRLAMSRDPTGELRRARAAALRAEKLAQTVGDTYQAAMLLSRIEGDLGHHPAELQQARILMRLAPRRRESLAILQRAAECNGLTALSQQASRALSGWDDRHFPPPQVSPPAPARPTGAPANGASPAEPTTPFERSLRQAWMLRTLATLAEDREREMVQDWNPRAAAGSAPESMGRLDLARDPSGELHEARTAAGQAVVLASTATERYRAVWLLARIDCDLGDHRGELQQAGRLVALEPHRRRSWDALAHARACNGLPPMAPHGGELQATSR